MYFSNLMLSSLAVMTATAGVIKRDFVIYQTAFTNVESALSEFQFSINAIQPFSNLNTTVANCLQKAQAFNSALTAESAAINASAAASAAASINATTTLINYEAAKLTSLFNIFVAQTEAAIDGLIAKAAIINSVGQQVKADFAKQLEATKQAGVAFIGATAAHTKVDVSYSVQVYTSFDLGIKTFGGKTSVVY